MKVFTPPIKCQGIKTKIVPNIAFLSQRSSYRRWIEPFMGSGVVAFNILPQKAILCDTNPHLIAFYNAIKEETITPEIAKSYLKQEGVSLFKTGEEHYYTIRDRFNKTHSPLDFLFLNRACFNGVMRFNSKGLFNVPFCKKLNRFSQSYITKITNQISNIQKAIQLKDYTFICQDFRTTFSFATPDDFIYCDPPYIDRHTDYFNQWSAKDEDDLLNLLSQTPASFVLSTWSKNDYRSNHYLDAYIDKFHVIKLQHFYHVGGSLDNRHGMEEALVYNFKREGVPILPTSESEDNQLVLNL